MLQWMLEQTFGSSLFEGVKEILTINPETQFAAAWNIMQQVYNNIMAPLGIGIMMVWFVFAFLEKTTHENFTFEQWFLLLMKLVACHYIIVHGMDLLVTFMSLGMSLFDKVQTMGGFTEPNNIAETAWSIILPDKDYGDASFIDTIKYMAIFLLPMLGALIAQIIIKVIAYSRLLEIFIRTAFAPLAFSDFFGQGMNGAGFRFLKSFLAVAVQGIIIYVILLIFNIMLLDVLNTLVSTSMGMMGFFGVYFAILFAAVSLILKSLSFAKELVGVN